MLIRPATNDDIPALIELARDFVAESAYGYTFSAENTERAFRFYIEDPYSAVVVTDDCLAGWIAFVAHEYIQEPVCYVAKFYIHPDIRNAGIANALMAKLTEWADSYGCVDTFATATAGVGADEAYVALCQKHGFEPVGQTLRRRYG